MIDAPHFETTLASIQHHPYPLLSLKAQDFNALGTNIANLFQHIPRSVKHLVFDLSLKDILYKEDFIQALKQLPKNIKELTCYSRFFIGNIDKKTMNDFTKQLPEGIKKVHFICMDRTITNDSLLDGDVLAESLQYLPATVEAVSLIGCLHSNIHMMYAAKNIPCTVLEVNLAYNDVEVDYLLIILSLLHKKITHIDLQHNKLLKKNEDAAALAKALKCLCSIKSINLGHNGFECLPAAYLKDLTHALPDIKTIYLDLEGIKKMNEEQRCALKRVFPNIERIILLDHNNKPISIDAVPELSYWLPSIGNKKTTLPASQYSGSFFESARNDSTENLEGLPENLQKYIQFLKKF